MVLQFRRATKEQAKLRLALVGPAGSGKTYTALNIAQHLGDRVALVDTEHGSASKYADLFEFDVVELESFHPTQYIEAIHAAEQAGYDVLVIDSLSHAWMGKDGALELVDKAAKRNASVNSFSAWRDVTPLHNQLVEAMIACRCHLVVTMRSKTEYVMDKDEKTGKTTIRKVGLQPVQRDGLEYEFDVVADLDLDNNLIVSKTRCPALSGAVIPKPGKEVADILRGWLNTGEAPAAKAAPAARQQAPTSSDATNVQALRAEVKNLMLQLGVKPAALEGSAKRKFGKAVSEMDAEDAADAIARMQGYLAQLQQQGNEEDAEEETSLAPAETLPPPPAPTKASQPNASQKAAKPGTGKTVSTSAWQPSQAQIKRLYAIAKAHGIDGDQIKEFMGSLFGKTNYNELTRSEYDELAYALEHGMDDMNTPEMDTLDTIPF